MPVIQDKEFGEITLRRSGKASSVRIRISPDGKLHISLPLYTPTLFARSLIHASRPKIRSMLESHQASLPAYTEGMLIGKSHTLIVRPAAKTRVSRHAQQIVVQLASHESLNEPHVAAQIREVVIKALRHEAKSYLSKRLSYLAEQHGYMFERVRFSHASGRWGSCSTSGTISLNIALMKLPFELIDYVLIHELCHTRQMNHSDRFWRLVEAADPEYRSHRRLLKQETPSI
jgi:predicted metal-dependent hydrolase